MPLSVPMEWPHGTHAASAYAFAVLPFIVLFWCC